MQNFILFFIALNIVNVIIQTTKSLLTINGNKWVASLVNAITYFVYTYVIFYTSSGSLGIFEKALIVAGCNLIGVFVVKLIEEKMQKEKLWIYQVTMKEDSNTVAQVHKLFKEMNIACVYNEVVKDTLYSLQVFTHTSKESQLVKTLLENYNVRYCAVETTESTPKKEKEREEVEF